MGTSEGKQLRAVTNPELGTRGDLSRPEAYKRKIRVPRVPTLNLSPSQAELFDFKYLLGRSSARIALFEIDPLINAQGVSSVELAERFWRSESRLVDGNETFFSAYGLTSVTECIGKPFAFFFPPTAQHAAMIKSWCSEGLVLGHFDLQTEELDGSQKAFSAAMYAVDERSMVKRFWIVLRDVTPLAKALSAVSQQELHYRNLVETSGFFMTRVNASGHPIYISPALEKLVGFSSKEFEDNHNLYRSLIHPDDLEAHDTIIAARASRASKVTEAEYRILCSDGTYRWVFERQTTSENVKAIEKRERTYFDSLIFDIQERKLLEAELHHSQRIDTVGKLAGGVAHDFNNYLTAIIGQLRLSLLEVPANSPTHERLLATEQAALRCAEMTKQLLSLAHKDELVKKIISVSHLVTTTASLCSHLLPSTICLSVEHSVRGLTVEGDENQLQQVLMNLMINARDAIKGVGSINLIAGQVEVSAKDSSAGVPPGSYVELRVKDSGSGIAPEHLAHIFEPFFTTKSSGHGTGLGLSLVYSILRNHGGTISVNSILGKGTEFTILLPLKTLAADTTSEQHQLQPSPLDLMEEDEETAAQSLEVLIVDDEPLVRSVIKSSLLGSGYRVSEVTNGEEALKLIEQEPKRFALIVIDQSMPSMNGKELVAKIRASGNQVPLLLTTGFTTFDGAPTAKNDIHEVIVKPFDPIDLISAAFRLCQSRNELPE